MKPTNTLSRSKFPLQLEGLEKSDKARSGKVSARASIPASGAHPSTAPLARHARPVLRPQQPLHQAATESGRHVQASGLGLDSADVRQRMVAKLRRAGLRDESVMQVLAQVPRHLFVDPGLANQAYEDTSLPIGLGQTISKPSIVARMIELLMAGETARKQRSLGSTLEIGTGCGYQAAVLSQLSKQVISVERLKPLHDKARELLAPLRIVNVRLVYGDGMRGHPPNAPYNSIIAAAGGEVLPEAWLSQLEVGGRLVAPVHQAAGSNQVLVVVDRTETGYLHTVHEAVNFVPLRSGLDEGQCQ
ncbi:MAG TPA: protein-L-isoaspartate(D-aspartate) O-methyltransferase [Rhizobacter sp.]|nr:protein-L-isoaspartate(D-aspartate) O-methyltransferase [Rhizobacter sp.]